MSLSLIIDLNFSVLMWKQFPLSPPLSLALKPDTYNRTELTFFFCLHIDRKRWTKVMVMTGKMAK